MRIEDYEAYDDSIEVAEILDALDALLPKGLSAIPRALGSALERDDYSDALAVARDRYAEQGPDDRVAALTYVILLIGRGLLSEARGILKKTLARYERDVPLQLAQAMAYARDIETVETARALLDAMVAADPSEARHWAFLGDVYFEIGLTPDALSAYEAALARGLEDPDLAYRAAVLASDEGRDFDAAALMERAARFGGGELNLWAGAAEAWLGVDEPQRAAEAWRRALQIGEVEHDPDVWAALGAAEREANNLEAARSALERALKRDPFHRAARTELAQTYIDSGLFEEALHAYESLLADHPHALEALHGAAAAAFELGDIDRAAELARRAIERAPEEHEGHYNLGVVLLELGRLPEAIAALERAADLEPIPEMIGALARAFARAGRGDDALAALGRAQEGGAPDELAVEIVEALLAAGDRRRAARLAAAIDSDSDTWALIGPILRYMLADAESGAEERTAALDAFDRAREERADALPYDWETDDLERASMRLDAERRRQVARMIRYLVRP